jgi:hypothetical protein
MQFIKHAIYCALFISLSSAQDCQSIFKLNSQDKNYWYGFSVQDLNKKSKLKKISQETLSGAISNLSSSIYSNVNSSYNVDIKEKLNNSTSQFEEDMNFNLDISSRIQGFEYELVSQGKCDSQYYAIIKLNKRTFSNKQKSSLISSLAEFDSLNPNDFAVLYDYLSFINSLYEKIDGNYFGLIDPSYQRKVSSAKNELKNEYMKSLSSVRPKFAYTLPYSIYENRPNNLRISFFSNSAKLNIVNSSADINFFQNTNRYYFNSMGEILMPINADIKNSSFVPLSITLNYNSTISSHYIFQNLNFVNPKFNFTIKPEPLVINFEHNFENSEIENAVLKTFNNILINSISVKLKNNDDAMYSLRVEALDYKKKMNTFTNTYIHLLDEVSISFVDNLNGDILFTLQIPNIKGLSYIGYDEALDKLRKNLKREGIRLSENIKNILIF